MSLNKNLTIMLTSILLPLSQQAASVELSNSSSQPNILTYQSLEDSCLSVISSVTAEVVFLGPTQGWQATIANNCAQTIEAQVEIEWRDASHLLLATDSVDRLVVPANGVAIARSGKILVNSNQISSHQVMVLGSAAESYSVANCLQVVSSAQDVVRIGGITLTVGWVAEIENSCSFDLFTTVDFALLSSAGYFLKGSNQMDVYVPANGRGIGRGLVLSVPGSQSGNVAGHAVDLQENQYYSSLETATRSFISPQAEYQVSTGSIFTSLFEPGSGYFDIVLEQQPSTGNLLFQLDISSINSIADPGGEIASFSYTDNILRIPALRLDDGSQTVTDLVLQLVDSETWLFEVVSFSEQEFVLSSYGEDCMQVDYLDTVSGPSRGPFNFPTVSYILKISNTCAANKRVRWSYQVLSEVGLLLQGVSGQSMIPALSSEEYFGDIGPFGFFSGNQLEVDQDMVTLEY